MTTNKIYKAEVTLSKYMAKVYDRVPRWATATLLAVALFVSILFS